MKRLVFWAPPLSLLFACSGSAVSLQPGQWETTLQFSSIEVPGAPAAPLAEMRQAMTRPQSHAECMTPEQAANPANRMFNQNSGPQNCQFSENTFSGGTIRLHAICQQAGRGSADMAMDGTYTPTTIDARVTTQMTAPPGTEGPQSIHMSGTITSRRIGDCAR